jgi:hypothetical protein
MNAHENDDSANYGLVRCTVKKVYRFSRPQPGCQPIKLSLAGNNLIIPDQGEFG